MRKLDKKLENQLRLLLTDVCEQALKRIEGFQWLTHVVNYANFPNSLKIVCVFELNAHLDNYLQSDDNNHLQSLIIAQLQQMNIKFNNVNNHILFDTEENCAQQHQGNWQKRLS